MTEQIPAIRKIRVSIGDDGLGYYTCVYGNGEPGPRSEGYGDEHNSEADNLGAAIEAATRDFPDLEIETE